MRLQVSESERARLGWTPHSGVINQLFHLSPGAFNGPGYQLTPSIIVQCGFSTFPATQTAIIPANATLIICAGVSDTVSDAIDVRQGVRPCLLAVTLTIHGRSQPLTDSLICKQVVSTSLRESRLTVYSSCDCGSTGTTTAWHRLSFQTRLRLSHLPTFADNPRIAHHL